MRRRLIIVCVMAWPLSGCATFASPPPSCDGFARRPLNRSLWDWEGTALAGPQPLAALPFAPIHTAEAGRLGATTGPNGAAAAPSMARDEPNASRLNDLASYRSCGKEG